MNISGIEEENKRILTDVDVIAKSNSCKNIVKCLGYIISESDVCIFMELMLSSFDKLLILNNGPLPETIIGKLSVSILNALNYLKEKHNMMHRGKNFEKNLNFFYFCPTRYKTFEYSN